MHCNKCGKPTGSGYKTNGVFKCTACSHNEQWYKDLIYSKKENPMHVKEDAKIDFHEGEQ